MNPFAAAVHLPAALRRRRRHRAGRRDHPVVETGAVWPAEWRSDCLQRLNRWFCDRQRPSPWRAAGAGGLSILVALFAVLPLFGDGCRSAHRAARPRVQLIEPTKLVSSVAGLAKSSFGGPASWIRPWYMNTSLSLTSRAKRISWSPSSGSCLRCELLHNRASTSLTSSGRAPR